MKPMFAEFINDLGRTATIPYVTPTTVDLANTVEHAAKDHDTIFMVNHGVLAFGLVMKQAFCRCIVTEQAAVALMAARATGTPRFLAAAQQKQLMQLYPSPRYRTK